MIAAFVSWWQNRTPREQRLLVLLAVIAAPVLLWLAVFRPIATARDGSEERYRAAVTDLAATERYAAQIRRLGGGVYGAAPPPAAIIESSANAAGLAVSAFEEVGNGSARITIEAARPQALFGWTRQVEANGFAVTSLSTRANEDRTLSASITFRGQRQ